MNLKEKFSFLFSIGFSIGLLIMVAVIAFAVPAEEMIGMQPFMPLQFIGSGLYGAICFSGTIVYDIDGWSLLKATLTHFAVTFSSFLIINQILKWYPNEILFLVLLMMVMGYALIWSIMYIKGKKQVEALNQKLERMKISNYHTI